jgi:hypothetical protein
MTSRPSPKAIYVITCGRCGQTWHRTGATHGDTLNCIFCGRLGQLALGLFQAEPRAGDQLRIEAWLVPPSP